MSVYRTPVYRRAVLLLATLTLLLAGGCGALLPPEPSLERSPVTPTQTAAPFATWTVRYGDLRLEQTIRFRYKPVREAELRFTVGGLLYDEILVKKGDVVSEGQLLANLDSGDIEPGLMELEYQLARQAMLREGLLARQGDDRERLELGTAKLTEAEQAERRRELEEQQAAELEAFDRETEILELSRGTLERRLDERRLVAPFAGIITYTRHINEGDRSSTNDQVVQLSDNERSLFLAKTDYASHFKVGERYEITLDEVSYPVVAVDPADYGMETDEKSAALRPEVEEMVFETDQSGTVVLLLDSREHVLLIPERAVFAAGERSYVYVDRGDRVREAREVTTGLRAGREVEITSGLEEGEVVIVD
ncbi:MAG: efflux RND transporter periplasmic adaptor subunit [Bacillota bacterium]|nr:efflux RND transporter periplasmic adaptor subunit [Bacillota bacterium]